MSTIYDQSVAENHRNCFEGHGEMWFENGEMCEFPSLHNVDEASMADGRRVLAALRRVR